MAWGVNHSQLMVAETYYLIIRQIMLRHWQRIGIIFVNLINPFPQLNVHQFFIRLMNFWQQSEAFVD